MNNRFTAAEVSKSIAGIPFPCDRDDLVEAAREGNAPPEVIAFMESLPRREYASPEEIMDIAGRTPETLEKEEMM